MGFGPSSPRYGHSTVWDRCGASGHGWPPNGPQKAPKRPAMGTPGSPTRSIMSQKAWLVCPIVNQAGGRRGGPTRGRYGGAQTLGPFWASFGHFWTAPPLPRGLRGPPQGPTKGCGHGVRILKRACVGEERRNLVGGLARSYNFFPEICVVKCCGIVVIVVIVVVACLFLLWGEGCGSITCWRGGSQAHWSNNNVTTRSGVGFVLCLCGPYKSVFSGSLGPLSIWQTRRPSHNGDPWG